MKIQSLVCTLMLALLVFAGDGLAIGPGSGQGGGGGGGDEVTIPDLGDLIMLYRDEYGVPYPSPVVTVMDPETELEVDGGQCLQPLLINPYDVGCADDCMVDGSTPPLVKVDQYNCAIDVGCGGCTQEVDFGRINSVRAPASVYESQLADVLVNLATADCVTLDPAGRMVASRVDIVDVVTSSAIDSPLQNLAIYRQLMLTGDLGTPLPPGATILDTAARGIGAGSDKGGEVNVDMVAYLNQIMGLDDVDVPTILGKLCETYREEVQGTIQLVEKCYLNYGLKDSDFPPTPPTSPAPYLYTRSDNFSIKEPSLPFPAYIPTDTSYGGFEYLAELDPEGPSFQIMQGSILDAVFPDTDTPFDGGNIGGFAQAADDTRAVINFMHDWPMPDADVYGTPLACSAGDPNEFAYDVSISEESGLQVPKVIVDGSEGREFTVTVANASGSADPASGTVTVTAIPALGGSIEGSPWSFDFEELAVGASESWTTFFTVNLGQRTKINWEAIADAPDDVILFNNTQNATSNVKVSGSGGGGGEE